MPESDATRLLLAGDQDDAARADLVALVGEELRSLAGKLLARERKDHTLQPTALVNEAWLRLIDTSVVADADRCRFVATAARCMRRVLIDHARRRQAVRRGGGQDWERVTLGPLHAEGAATASLVELSDLLERFDEVDPRGCRVVELKVFGGLTEPEISEVLGVSSRTVRSDWRSARAWLKRELGLGELP